MAMIQRGGQWKKSDGELSGNGLFYHYRELQKMLWPFKVWHKWSDLQLEAFLGHRTIAVLGPASSGKTHEAASFVLSDWLCFPDTTTVLVCSTTKERLEDRIWGEIKRLFRSAKEAMPTLPGYLIEGRQRITLDRRSLNFEEESPGRDFRNGLIGVPCKKGESFIGISDFVGIKNKRIRLVGDELSLLPGAFVDAISNLDKNPDVIVIGLGNPKDTLDALGRLAQPEDKAGGWEGGVDQMPGTKSWPTKRTQGIALQLPGDDSPNLDGKLGIPLITAEAMARDESFYGKDSLWYTMFNLGRMPRGQGSRRVLTSQMCRKFGAFKEPLWLDSNRIQIAFLDAAYRGVGGDRCIFGTLEFGREAEPIEEGDAVSNLIFQRRDRVKYRQIIAVNEIKNVPINPGFTELPEDQIVKFVMEQCKARGIPPDNLYYDAGMRTSLVTCFSRLWSPLTNSIDFGGKPSNRAVSYDITTNCREYYSKFVTELWFTVRLAVEASQVRSLTEDIVNEFAGREWKVVAGNKIEVENKEDMKRKFGRSPDIADAIVAGFYGAIQRGFVIAKLGDRTEGNRKQNVWLSRWHQKARKIWQSGALTNEARPVGVS